MADGLTNIRVTSTMAVNQNIWPTLAVAKKAWLILEDTKDTTVDGVRISSGERNQIITTMETEMVTTGPEENRENIAVEEDQTIPGERWRNISYK